MSSKTQNYFAGSDLNAIFAVSYEGNKAYAV